jgi:hypothetical protein
MPSYPPRDEPVRKRQILKKREKELRHALSHGSSSDRLETAAEKVRFAKLKLIKAIVGELRYRPQSEELRKQWAKAETEEALWKSMPVNEIIEQYEIRKS